MATKGKYHDIDAILESGEKADAQPPSAERKKRPSPAIGAMTGNKMPTRTVDTLKAEKESIEKSLKEATEGFQREKQELLKQLESLQSATSESSPIALTMPVTKQEVTFKLVSIDPALIDVSPENERMQQFLDEVSLKDILPSIRKHGQQKPGTVRPKESGRFELIEGSRRLVAVRIAKQPYLALVGDVPDADVRELSVIENKHQDVSPYEKAKAYQRQIDNGEFSNWTQLGAAYGISSSHISRYKACIELDELFVRILPTPSDMSLSYAETISRFVRKGKEDVYEKAQELLVLRKAASHQDVDLPGAEEIIRILKSVVRTRSIVPTVKKPVPYRSSDGSVLLKHSITNRGSNKFELSGVTDERVDKILDYLISTLKVERIG